MLPTYSPELNPVELIFSKIKKILRTREIFENLLECILDAFQSISFEDVIGYYQHCGYW